MWAEVRASGLRGVKGQRREQRLECEHLDRAAGSGPASAGTFLHGEVGR